MSLEAVAQARRRGEKWTAAVTEEIFADADVLMTPVLPSPADTADHFQARRPWRTSWHASTRSAYTTAWNIAGFPAASVPAGFTGEGLPLAVQLCLPGKERLLLALSGQLQRAADWTDRRPRL